MSCAPPAQYHALDSSSTGELAAQARAGLLSQPAAVSPKFFYDALGSRLFEAITELDEYGLTRAEAAIFDAHGAVITEAARARIGRPFDLVDLGAGDCAKAARLIPLLQPSRYLALDIATEHLRPALQRLQAAHPQLPMLAIGTDFSERLALPRTLCPGPALVFYPGSSIGNFDPEAALRLLAQARELAGSGALLIGVDLVKGQAELEAAYDDALGVTAAFNLNLLRHLNRLIGSDFDPRQWRHLARFDAARSRIEMHLLAREDLTVRWPGGQRHFAAGESIHTENSYKWTLPDFAALLRDAGWREPRHWCDPAEGFAVVLAS
ncbi:MAG TPA: L-histidine N(alpha)-methyltransferase [Rubrivivax sp.]|nr:L-histidine N(alpha)-methyltransferase [Burkholderiales bacterium]HNU12315.1 L-histidine N(alpha)-methyltransferase [Rubrivivax sp.]